MDYSKYRLDRREWCLCLGVSMGLAGVIAWLFYRSIYGMLCFPVVYVFYRKRYKREHLKERTMQLLTQFADAMQAVSSALLAGYSMEHAWQESQKEMEQLWGRDSYIGRELAGMNTVVAMNEPLEKVLGEFAKRSGCEDIESFAEIFTFAKRGGGDFARIIHTTVLKLTDKIEVEQEIATVLAGKRLEGRIMDGMPLFILAYLNLTSGDFLAALYGNLLGAAIMTGALAGYFAALRLSEHILDIHV